MSVDALPASAERPARKPIPPRGWLIIGICLIGISTGPAAFGLASLGLVINAFQHDFGWTRGEVSGAASLMMLCTALSLPLVGKLVDKFGARRVLIPSVIALGLCLLAIPFVVTKVWQFMAAYILIGTVAAGANSVPYMRILASWFDRSRGLAIGIAGSGTGLGFAYVPLVGQAASNHFGWHGVYVALALIMLCVTLPMVLFLLKEKTADQPNADSDSLVPEVNPADALGDTLKQAMGKRDFWVLVSVFVSLAFVLYGLIPHMVPLLTDRGMTPEAAATMASIFGFATFGGRILIGFLVDRFDARRIAVIFFGLSALGMALLATPLPTWALIFPALLLGGSLGAEVDMLAYLTSRYFGLKSFAQIFGVLFSAVMVAMGLGPVAFGAVYDLTGSYQIMLAIGAPVCILAAGLMLILRPFGERRRGAAVSVT
jgi:MFS family permease